MAEAFGIFSGAVGVVAVFSTCVECFDYIQTGRRFGQDFQTRRLSLSLLQLRLSRWGEAVNIYNDPKLGRPQATQAELDLAKDTLFQILVLFEDSQKVAAKYRVEASSGADTSSLARSDLERRLDSLENRMRALAARRQKQTGLGKLASWALHRKGQLDDLIEDVTRLLDNLTLVFPEPETAEGLAQADTEEITGGTAAEQALNLETLQQLGEKIDKVLAAQSVEVAEKRGISIDSIRLEEGARMQTGNVISSAWKGETNLPTGNGTITIGTLHASGNARIRSGDVYGERDEFWD